MYWMYHAKTVKWIQSPCATATVIILTHQEMWRRPVTTITFSSIALLAYVTDGRRGILKQDTQGVHGTWEPCGAVGDFAFAVPDHSTPEALAIASGDGGITSARIYDTHVFWARV
jgi:hypothetical protein